MTALSTARARLSGLARTQHSRYAGDADRPLGGYATLGELVTCPFCTSVWVATGLEKESS